MNFMLIFVVVLVGAGIIACVGGLAYAIMRLSAGKRSAAQRKKQAAQSGVQQHSGYTYSGRGAAQGGMLDDEQGTVKVNIRTGNQVSMSLLIDSPEGRREQNVTFSGHMQIGRGRDCEVSINEGYISRHHVELMAFEDGVFARNLKPETRSYTHLNQQALGDEPLAVYSGDILRIGETSIRMTYVE